MVSTVTESTLLALGLRKLQGRALAGKVKLVASSNFRVPLLFKGFAGMKVTRALTGLKLQVSSAKISTYGEKVVDVFYVKDLFGHKVEHAAKLKEIRTTLEAAPNIKDAEALLAEIYRQKALK